MFQTINQVYIYNIHDIIASPSCLSCLVWDMKRNLDLETPRLSLRKPSKKWWIWTSEAIYQKRGPKGNAIAAGHIPTEFLLCAIDLGQVDFVLLTLAGPISGRSSRGFPNLRSPISPQKIVHKTWEKCWELFFGELPAVSKSHQTHPNG